MSPLKLPPLSPNTPYTGIVKVVENWCAYQGLYIPTAEEREAAAIKRLLEMEGLAL